MPGTPTPNYGLDTMNGAVDVASTIDDTYNAAMGKIDSKMVGYSAGLLGARPPSTGGSPGIPGRRYRATDTGQEFIDTGTSWDEIATTPVADASLDSPNNDVWRPIFTVGGSFIPGGFVAGTYALRSGFVATGASGSMYSVPIWIPPTASDVDVAGRTARVRLSTFGIVNGVAPGVTLTFGLRPITAAAGSGDMSFTLGAAVATCVYVTPPIGGIGRVDSSPVTLASLTGNAYCIAVTTSGATTAANSYLTATAALEMQHS